MPAALCLALLIPATLACALYLLPTLFRRRPRPRRLDPFPRHHFTVLVPSHNEESTLPAALRSLRAADYPPALLHVVVVADNCADRTAAVAAEAGATALVRCDPNRRGKGFALAYGLAHVLKPATDVVLVLDADCELNVQGLRHLAAAFAAGAAAVQTAVRSRNADDGPGGYAAAVGTAVDNAVAAGLDRMGVSVALRGTGMAFRREVLEAVPWDAFSNVEDAEYGRRLARAAVRVRFAAGAVVGCEAPADIATLLRQRRRWRAAVATPGRSLFIRAAASKPLVLAQLALSSLVSIASWLLKPNERSLACLAWAAMLVLLTGGLYLRAAAEVGLSRHRLRLFAAAPALVVRLGALTLAGLFRRRPAEWDRTPRTAAERRAA